MSKIKLGKLILCTESRKLQVGSKQIKLRNKEFLLLNYLIENLNKAVSRTELLEAVWDRNIFCSTNTVDVHVSTLRQKIKKHLKNNFIKTIHCLGYMFEIDNEKSF